MTELTSAPAGRPEDAQCYNCGLKGHWAVACPEPTRETPAGLAAWRNASHAAQGHSKNLRAAPKKQGLIITKYAVPPSLGPGMAQYPPPPGPSYPGPTPQFHPGYPHFPPGQHYPSGYATPQAYPAQQYPPAAPYGQPQVGPPGYAGPPVGPAGPVSYSPGYASYPPAGSPGALGYGLQPTYNPAYPQPPAYVPPPPSLPPPPPPAPLVVYPSSGRPMQFGPPAVSSHKPPPIQLPREGIHPSLPPKPPQPQPQLNNRESHRDKKHGRRNHIRHQRHQRDNRHHRRSFHPQPRNGNRSSSMARPSPRATTPGVQIQESSEDSKPRNSPSSRQDSTLERESQEPQSEHRSETEVPEHFASDRASDDEKYSKESGTLKGSEASHAADEVSAPLSGPCNDDTPSLRNRDTESVTPNLEEESTRGIHGVHGHPSKSNPVRVCDGELPSGNSLPSTNSTSKEEHSSSQNADSSDEDRTVRKRHRGDDQVDDERDQKRTRTIWPWVIDTEGSRDDSEEELTWGFLEPEPRRVRRRVDRQESDQTLPDIRPRSPLEEQRRLPNGSRASRSESVSSRSSDLNSLEAELLGRPNKQRSPIDPELRQECQAVSKPKPRNRATADSAYSRRW